MAKGKLILICQSGGDFKTNDDGSLSYTGGEAHAVDINRETTFDNLKFKLAEMCNLEYKSLFIKYFLPGNKRTLITLSSDRDLNRMYDFHSESVTADVYVMGRAGFNREDFDMHIGRECGIKPAETVTATPSRAVVATPSRAVAATPSRAAAATPSRAAAATPPRAAAATRSRAAAATRSRAAAATRSRAAATTWSRAAARSTTINTTPTIAPAQSPTGIVDVPIVIDMGATPADTVKKRRRSASWKSGVNGPIIVSVTDNVGETTKSLSRKRNIRNRPDAVANDEELDTGLWIEDSNCTFTVANSNNVPLERLVASWKDGITGIGQDFKSVQEFRDALQKYAIAHRFAYRLKKNDTNRASGTCIVEDCSWRIHASWVPSEQVFRIKKMNESHTCGGESWKAAHPTKNWLVNIIKERLRDNPHHKPKEIANGIFQDFGIELNYTQVWRGIEDAREQLQGSYKEAYNQLPCFCDKMVESNPGSVVKLYVGDDRKFQRLFVSFHASIHGFQNGCRPLLFLDAASLKSKYHEILLTASALDGDDGVFPVAFAIVDIENDDNWHWFLEQLRSAVSTSRSITFVSDKEKGLMKTVLEIFENAHHGFSIYHLMESFMKNLKGPFHGDGKGSLPVSFMAAAHAVRLDGFRMFTEQIKSVSSNAYNWVMEIEPEHWANAVFKGERYNQVTFDVADSYTNWIEEVRELPIIQKVEKLTCKVMELMNDHRLEVNGWSSKLTPSKEEKLREESLKARGLKVLFSSDTLFEVHDDYTNVVDIAKWDCSCLGWKATGLPCRHAIAVFNCTGRSAYDYCSRFFTVDSFRSAYSESINPVANFKPLGKEQAASQDGHVLPPSTPRPPTQQKKKQTGILGEFKRTVSCTRCKGEGHNKVTCKEIL